MRLSHIHEDDISRRDFLQKSGGLASLLVGGGLSPEVASVIASPNPPQLIATIITGDTYSRIEPDVADSLKDVAAAYNTLRRLLGRNAGIGGGSTNGEFFSLGSYINPEDVAKLLKSGEVRTNNREGDDIHIDIQLDHVKGIWSRPGVVDSDRGCRSPRRLQISNAVQGDQPDENYIAASQERPPSDQDHPFFTAPRPDDFESYDSAQTHNVKPLGLKPQNLIKAWWNGWEKFGTSYLDKATFSLLRKNGIDPTRVNVIRNTPSPHMWQTDELELTDEQIMARDNSAKGYNTPNKRKKAIGNSEPEEWEGVEPEKPEKPEEPEKPEKSEKSEKSEKLEKLEKPRDYNVASSMHQWVENKSRFEAELNRVLSHIH
jgi:hypothetical protein